MREDPSYRSEQGETSIINQSQSHITTGSQPASPSWCQAPSGTSDQFFFLLEIIVRQLRVCYFVAPFLTRGRVRNLLLLLVLASAVTLGLPSLTRGRICVLSESVYSQSECT
jgi:hypothetical protein